MLRKVYIDRVLVVIDLQGIRYSELIGGIMSMTDYIPILSQFRIRCILCSIDVFPSSNLWLLVGNIVWVT